MPLAPTPEQAAIIEAASGEDNLMIEALAGTGKTSTLELMAPTLALQGPALALAFNVKIRDELKARMPASIGPYELKVQTLNGLGHGTWWSFVRRNLDVDSRKSTNILKAICEADNIRLSKEEFSSVNDLVAAAKAIGFMPKGCPMGGSPIYKDTDDGLEVLFEWAAVDYRQDLEVLFRKALLRSINLVLSEGQLDFNDQLYMPVIFNAPFKRYDTVLVDEAQDLSALNHRMIEKSCGRRMIVVGDRHQAIYAFRGAMSNSMEALEAKRPFTKLPLTMTFRCGKAIVARAQGYVPDYRAAPSNPEGSVETWTEAWGISEIPHSCAIICRNNAPLFKLAFKLMRQGRGVKMLGNDIGKALERALDNATKRLAPNTPASTVAARVDDYFHKEIAKAKTDRKKDSLQDRWECVRAIVDNSHSLEEAKRTCHNLFENPNAVVTLSSGHKSKGLEWDNVIHLDPWRIPSKWAETDEELQQEDNLRYVIETRAKLRLILADLEDFK